MDIKWIADFLSVARTRNFSRAADERHVTQPALSRRIRALEAWVGAELIDRSVYPPDLTPAGRLFRDQAEETLRQLDDTRALLRRQEAPGAGALVIAAGHTLSLNTVPPWLARMQREVQPFNARIVAANFHDAVLALAEGSCDLLFCYHHESLPIELDPTRYAHRALGTDRLVPVCAPGPRGPRHRPPGTRDAPVPLLVYTPGSFLGRAVEQILAGAPRPQAFERRYESDLAELLKRMALAGDGLAWLPESAVREELDAGQLVEAAGPPWSLTLQIRLYRSLANDKPLLQRLWAAIPA